MKRLSRITFILAVAIAMAYKARGQGSLAPEPIAPAALRQIIDAPNGGLKATQPDTVIGSIEIRGFAGPGTDGRGLTLFAPGASVFDTIFTPGTDDALGLVGDCRGTLIANCVFPLRYFRQNNPSKALICYTGPRSSEPGPMYGAADGYAGTFIRDRFEGSAIRIRDGVWRFEGCDVAIGALYGIDMIDPCRANIVGVNFREIPKPADATYWGGAPPVRLLRHVKNAAGETTYLRTSLKSRLWIWNCTINGRRATPQEICPGVPSYVFLKEPN